MAAISWLPIINNHRQNQVFSLIWNNLKAGQGQTPASELTNYQTKKAKTRICQTSFWPTLMVSIIMNRVKKIIVTSLKSASPFASWGEDFLLWIQSGPNDDVTMAGCFGVEKSFIVCVGTLRCCCVQPNWRHKSLRLSRTMGFCSLKNPSKIKINLKVWHQNWAFKSS